MPVEEPSTASKAGKTTQTLSAEQKKTLADERERTGALQHDLDAAREELNAARKELNRRDALATTARVEAAEVQETAEALSSSPVGSPAARFDSVPS